MPRSTALPLSLSLPLVVAAACSALPTEPRSSVRLTRPWGHAAANTEGEAQRLAQAIEQALAVYRELEGFEERPIRAHLTDRDVFPAGFQGVTYQLARGEYKDGWLAVRASSAEVEHTIAHELVHLCFDELLSVFPTVVEEGACELLADRVNPTPDLEERRWVTAAAGYLDDFTVTVSGKGAKQGLAYLVQEVAPIEQVLALDWRGHLHHEDRRTVHNNYGFGWVLAKAISFDGLVELDRRREAEGLASVPPAWILAAARLDPSDPVSLNAAFVRARGGEPTAGELTRINLTLTGAKD